MTVMRPLQIDAQWLDKGYFLLWSEPYIPPKELAGVLFSYHKPSYYGTFVRTEKIGPRELLVLPVGWSVSYWLSPPVAGHAMLIWSEKTRLYGKIARYVEQALRGGLLMPDYGMWRRGAAEWRIAWHQMPGFKNDADAFAEIGDASRDDIGLSTGKEENRGDLPHSGAVHASGDERRSGTAAGMSDALTAAERAFADRWLSRLIRSVLQHPGHSDDELLAMFPAYDRCAYAQRKMLELKPAQWIDEKRWLHMLGWEEDPAPFLLALQLSEPEGSDQWRLAIRVRSRTEPASYEIVCSVSGDVLEGSCPSEWKLLLEDAVYREALRITDIVPELAGPGDPRRMTDVLDDDQAWRFLMEWSARLLEHGVSVLLPSWWEQAKRARAKLHTRLKPYGRSPGIGMRGNLLGVQQLLEFDWKVSIGDLELTREEFERIVEQQKKLISVRGRWIVIDQTLLRIIQKKLRQYERQGGIPLQDVLESELLKDAEHASHVPISDDEAAESIEIRYEYDPDIGALLSVLKRVVQPPLIPKPRQLQGELRRYQLEGVSWLAMLRRTGFGGCLADDMGLGKTVQWIAYLLHVKETENPRRPSLLICPTSVLGNWQKELARFAPTLNVHLHHGPARLRGDAFRQAAQSADVVLTSYALAALDRDDLCSLHWDSVCLDEAQNIKNAFTKQAQAIRRLSANHRVAMTGTPVENRLSELWSIMHFVNPGYLGNLRSFERMARRAERLNSDKPYGIIQALIRPFLLRREKNDPAVSVHLPPKEELKWYVTLTPEQSALYEQQLDRLFQRIGALAAMERRGAVLSAIMRLKQLCDHPAMLHGHVHMPVDTLLEQSNKLQRLTEMVEEVRGAGERCLIFTQFVAMGHLLQHVLRHRLKQPVMFMHGGIGKKMRDRMIAEFQRQETECGVFILSLKTGGTGLNLTTANHVFHYDRWWNPAVENQASDRVYRIGQQRNVFVHKLMTIGTLEEKIDELLEHKLELSHKIIGGEHWIGELSNEELRELLELRTV